MKNQLSVNPTVYENENSCLEDVLAIADELKLKTRRTDKLTAGKRRKSESVGSQQLASANVQRSIR